MVKKGGSTASRGGRKAGVSGAIGRMTGKKTSLAGVTHVNFFVGGKFKRFALDGKASTMRKITDHVNTMSNRKLTMITFNKGAGKVAHVYDAVEMKTALKRNMHERVEDFCNNHLDAIAHGRKPKAAFANVDITSLLNALPKVKKDKYKYTMPKRTSQVTLPAHINKKKFIKVLTKLHNKHIDITAH